MRKVTRVMVLAGAGLAVAAATLVTGCAKDTADRAAQEAEQEKLERERREQEVRDLERGKDEARERLLNRDD